MPFKIVAKLTEALGRSAQPSERLPQILLEWRIRCQCLLCCLEHLLRFC